jgi:hypothetical protein
MTIFSGACAESCGYGSYWAGVGLARTRNNPPATVTLTQWVYDYNGGDAVPGAAVSVCRACPCTADNVLDQQQTDPTGYVTLRFPAPTLPNENGSPYCLQASASGYLTTFFYRSVPYTESVVSIHDSLLPPQATGTALVKTTFSNPNHLNVGVRVFDCLTNTAPGVDISIAVVPSTTPAASGVEAGAGADDAAVDGGTGAWEADATTSAQNLTILFSAPPGIATLTATVPGIGVVSQISGVNIMPDTVIGVGLLPTP